MGSAGHKFISHTKALSPAAQVGDGGYGPPPHPVTVRPGQRYWPRRGKFKRAFVVRSVAGNRVTGLRLDGDREPVKLSRERLLARRPVGQGSIYQFQGFVSRSYATFAYVVAIEEDEAVLCFPEWHPRRPVSLFLTLVPEPARAPGAWLSLKCDLAASSGARLQPNTIEPSTDPGPDRLERPDLEAIFRLAA